MPLESLDPQLPSVCSPTYLAAVASQIQGVQEGICWSTTGQKRPYYRRASLCLSRSAQARCTDKTTSMTSMSSMPMYSEDHNEFQ